MTVIAYREAWLTELAERFLWPLIEKQGGKKPAKWRLSIGFPKAHGGRRSIGQCWSTTSSADGTFEMFVSPEPEVFDAVHVTLHECVHASVGLAAGHKKPFKDLATACGLTGKMTATTAGEALAATIKETWLPSMPAFPGAVLQPGEEAKKPGSRLIKAECPQCGYTVRITAKWLAIAVPHCPNPDCTPSRKIGLDARRALCPNSLSQPMRAPAT